MKAMIAMPLVVSGSIPGHEIEHPMAVVILGGVITSTLLNLCNVSARLLAVEARRADD